MKWPPFIMKLRIVDNERNVRLWLPIFLLYPFLLVLALILELLAFAAWLFFWPWGWGKTLLLFIPYLCRVICTLRELEVDIKQSKEQFYISFI